MYCIPCSLSLIYAALCCQAYVIFFFLSPDVCNMCACIFDDNALNDHCILCKRKQNKTGKTDLSCCERLIEESCFCFPQHYRVWLLPYDIAGLRRSWTGET